MRLRRLTRKNRIFCGNVRNSFQPPGTITSELLNRNIAEAERERMLFSDLKKHPKLRHSLPSINAARANMYGTRSIGQKQWYNESFDVIKGLKKTKNQKIKRCGTTFMGLCGLSGGYE